MYMDTKDKLICYFRRLQGTFIQLDHRTPSVFVIVKFYLILSDNYLFLNRRKNSVLYVGFSTEITKELVKCISL